MKRSDLYLIIVVGIVAAIFSLVISKAVFGSPGSRSVQVPVVTPISANFPSVSSDPSYQKIFNPGAIDPTQLIRIGGKTNPQPFTGQ